jgi:endonuclease YncB( thermonuclease family)
MNILDIYNYKNYAEVLKVVDGDTIWVLTDFGVCKIKQKLRLNRIDTPEKFGKYKEIGLAITSHVKDLINNSCNKIFVHAIGSDLYGRVISEIFLHDNTNLSDYLLNNKLCKPCSGKRDEWTNEDYKITNDYINSLCKK